MHLRKFLTQRGRAHCFPGPCAISGLVAFKTTDFKISPLLKSFVRPCYFPAPPPWFDRTEPSVVHQALNCVP